MPKVLPLAETSWTELVQEEARDFRVQSRVYTDPLLYDQEMREIFERSWVYIGHASEIAQPGDYRTGRIGTQPIIVARSKDGDISVLLNGCRHRANAIRREERGNSLNFRCPYHAWTYRNSGELIGVADCPGYPEGFSTEDLGLMKAPRVGVYRGLIFASLSGDVPSLADHLSPISHLIDLWADRSLEGEHRVLLPHKYGYQGTGSPRPRTAWTATMPGSCTSPPLPPLACGTSPEPPARPPGRASPPADAPAGAAPAGVQVTGARPAVPRLIRPHRPARPPAAD
jgi:nitrite reductase/ring-hydroxylating ferredoxin subunit